MAMIQSGYHWLSPPYVLSENNDLMQIRSQSLRSFVSPSLVYSIANDACRSGQQIRPADQVSRSGQQIRPADQASRSGQQQAQLLRRAQYSEVNWTTPHS